MGGHMSYYGWAQIDVDGYGLGLGMGTNSKENVGLWCEQPKQQLLWKSEQSCEDSEPENVEMSDLGVESSNALGR